MPDYWVAIVFGWPAVVLALVLSVVAVARGKPLLLGVAILLLAPFCLYLIGTPRGVWMGVAVPLLLVSAALAVWRGRLTAAWCCLAGVAALAGWVAVVVVR